MERMTVARNVYSDCKAWKEYSKDAKWLVSPEGKRVAEFITKLAKMEQDGTE